MEYKLKLSLTDEAGNPLVSTSFDEQYLKDITNFHPQLDWIAEIIRTMKLQHETGSPADPYKPQDNSSVIPYLMTVIDGRRHREEFGLLQWIEDGVRITKEDVQDYTACTDLTGDEAYAKLKAYWNKEILWL